MSELGSAGVRAQRLAGSVTSLLDDVFGALSPLVSVVRDILIAGDPDERAATLRASPEAPAVAALMGTRTVAVSGVGFVAEFGQVVPAQSWMAWWVERDGVVKEKLHNLNPVSDAFYDYRHAEWFYVPRRTGDRCVSGPYIDSWGTDDFTITAAMPVLVLVHDTFAGVVAADLAVRRFEVAISGQLRAVEAPAALVNGEDRVVASGVSDLTTGLRLSPRATAGPSCCCPAESLTVLTAVTPSPTPNEGILISQTLRFLREVFRLVVEFVSPSGVDHAALAAEDSVW
jgi:hypothetical protein